MRYEMLTISATSGTSQMFDHLTDRRLKHTKCDELFVQNDVESDISWIVPILYFPDINGCASFDPST